MGTGNHIEKEIPTPPLSLAAMYVRAKQSLGPEVVMRDVCPQGISRRVTRLQSSLSGAPAVAAGSHCFDAAFSSRPMITSGAWSVLSNT